MRDDILESRPDAPLRVYTVWLPTLVTDARSEWEPGALPDVRVQHFWDEERVIGEFLAVRDLGGLGASGLVWDAAFVFGPEATWDDVPGPLLASGSPVISNTDELGAALEPLLGR